MKSDIVIVGGGFSGTAVAYHLLQSICEFERSKRPLTIAVLEPGKLAGGIAYGTESPVHLLNVPAAKMSLTEECPEDFVSWMQESGLPYSPTSFVPRKYYRAYLSAALEKATAEAKSLATLQSVPHRAVAVSRSAGRTFSLTLSSGDTLRGSQVVLAMGNSLGESAESPWSSGRIASAKDAATVAIVGTGLTAIDVVLELEQWGFTGSYTLISRHGRLPAPHASEDPHPGTAAAVASIEAAPGLRGKLREFQRSRKTGLPWRALIDALRPVTASMWSNLSVAEKREFISRIRPLWDPHRHRVPAESLQVLLSLRDKGRLSILRERFSAGELSALQGRFDAIFDCRGIWSDLSRCGDPLVSSLLAEDLAALDGLALGFKTGPDGQLLTAHGPTDGMYTLGSLRRGELWETTAAREIRAQAAAIAKLLLTAAA